MHQADVTYQSVLHMLHSHVVTGIPNQSTGGGGGRRRNVAGGRRGTAALGVLAGVLAGLFRGFLVGFFRHLFRHLFGDLFVVVFLFAATAATVVAGFDGECVCVGRILLIRLIRGGSVFV